MAGYLKLEKDGRLARYIKKTSDRIGRNFMPESGNNQRSDANNK